MPRCVRGADETGGRPHQSADGLRHAPSSYIPRRKRIADRAGESTCHPAYAVPSPELTTSYNDCGRAMLDAGATHPDQPSQPEAVTRSECPRDFIAIQGSIALPSQSSNGLYLARQCGNRDIPEAEIGHGRAYVD